MALKLLGVAPSGTTDAATKDYVDTGLSGKQASDADLTSIAGLSPSNDDIIQRKSGAWANRTLAQVKTDLAIRYFNIRDYGAVPTGGTNNTTAIQAAIDAASAEGGTVYIPADGVYEFGSQLLVTKTVAIEGDSTGGYFFDLTQDGKGSRLKWTGGASVAILVRPSSSDLGRPVVGVVISNLTIDGNNLAGTGLRYEAALQPILSNVAIRDCVDQALWIGGTTLGSYTGLNMTYGGLFQNLWISERSTSYDAHGIVLDGDPVGGYANGSSNTLNVFANVHVAHNDGTALKFVKGDHNYFYNLNTSRRSGGTGYAIEFGAVASGKSVNGNEFFGVYADSVVKSYGTATNTVPASNNVMYGYSLADNATIPTVDTGSSLYWSSWNGQSNIQKGPGPLLVGGTAGQTAQIVTGSLLEVQGPNANTDPLAVIGSVANAKLYTLRIRNNFGQSQYFIAAATNEGLTGTAAGDAGCGPLSSGKAYHIGGTTKVISVTRADTLGFFGATPVAKPTGNALTALTNLGLVGSPTLAQADVGLGNVDNTSNATERAATATLTNKRVTPRTGTTTSSATPTINTDNVDFYSLTAQAANITSFTTNLSGTPTDGQKLWIAITGTAARTITWGASFEASTVALPTTTVSTNRLDVGFVWNAVTSKWRCVATC